jgi:hypothetical protein
MTSHRAFDVANEGLPITLSSDFGRQQTLYRKPQLDPAFQAHLGLDQLHVVARAREIDASKWQPIN